MHTPASPDAPQMGFSSDNIAGASPEILAALAAACHGQAQPYGADEGSAQVRRQLADIFEREVDVLLVPTGTAANSLSLSALTPPWGSVCVMRKAISPMTNAARPSSLPAARA